jgi:enoyl-CoA hydratase
MTATTNDEFRVVVRDGISLLTLASEDGTNRLTAQKVLALTQTIQTLAAKPPVRPLVITGVPAFSAGADLKEISELNGPSALTFAKMGQTLMLKISEYPALVCAAIQGYCMGGGLDLALACRYRIASPQAVFGHRGAALGLITGWGGTQRLPRLVGKARAMQMFVAAEKLHALEALRIGLVDAVADHPVEECVTRLRES